MRTRCYSFKASGTVQDPVSAAVIMKRTLNEGPESIWQRLYGEFSAQKDRDFVDRVDFIKKNDELSAIEINTYDWFPSKRKSDILQCVALAAQKADPSIRLQGSVTFLKTNENLPKYLYHIAERKNLDNILQNGLLPMRGNNDWKSKKCCTYFTEAQYIAPWLGILKNVEDPVILEIDTSKNTSIEQGRVWEDREYISGRLYSEHRAVQPTPPDALRVISPDEVRALGVVSVAADQLMRALDERPTSGDVITSENEAKCCLNRLREMAVIDENEYTKILTAYDNKAASQYYNDFTACVSSLPESGASDEITPF